MYIYIQKVYNSRFTSEIKKLEKYYDPKAKLDYKQTKATAAANSGYG